MIIYSSMIICHSATPVSLDPAASQEQLRFISHLGKVGGSVINDRDLGSPCWTMGKITVRIS
jgi:hypothetical protein